ncbi:hypothetical protein D3C81_1281910 [compost metagenome]
MCCALQVSACRVTPKANWPWMRCQACTPTTTARTSACCCRCHRPGCRANRSAIATCTLPAMRAAASASCSTTTCTSTIPMREAPTWQPGTNCACSTAGVRSPAPVSGASRSMVRRPTRRARVSCVTTAPGASPMNNGCSAMKPVISSPAPCPGPARCGSAACNCRATLLPARTWSPIRCPPSPVKQPYPPRSTCLSTVTSPAPPNCSQALTP